jgi:hypothetical protein
MSLFSKNSLRDGGCGVEIPGLWKMVEIPLGFFYGVLMARD